MSGTKRKTVKVSFVASSCSFEPGTQGLGKMREKAAVLRKQHVGVVAFRVWQRMVVS